MPIVDASGGAHVISFEASSPAQHYLLTALFDRTADYLVLKGRLDACGRDLSRLPAPAAHKALGPIVRDLAARSMIDFSPGNAQAQLRSTLADVQAAMDERFLSGEPRPVRRRIPRRERKDYRHRFWATREHLWIDRVWPRLSQERAPSKRMMMPCWRRSIPSSTAFISPSGPAES
jgi:hypothetical protein